MSDAVMDIYIIPPEERMRALAERLAEGHLAILSQPWQYVAYEDDDDAVPHCPVCKWTAGAHYSRCPWLLAARACGVLP